MSLKGAAQRVLQRNSARNASATTTATPRNIPATLDSRVRAMAARWHYAPDELAEAQRLAVEDLAAWRRLVEHHERLRYAVADESPEQQPIFGRCADCTQYRRTTHPYLGHCAAGAPEPVAGLWGTTPRLCDYYRPASNKDLMHD